MRRHADKRKEPLLIDVFKKLVPVISDEFSHANMRSMIANDHATKIVSPIVSGPQAVTFGLGLYGHS